MSESTRDRATVQAELAAAEAERAEAKGSAKGQLTKRVQALQAELASMPVAEKKWAKNAAFDSATIVAEATSGKHENAEQLAAALGLEITPALKRRLSWLVKVDQLIDPKFLASPAKKAKAAKQEPAEPKQETPDLASQLAASVKQAKAAKRTSKA
jgi:hypothetical protein